MSIGEAYNFPDNCSFSALTNITYGLIDILQCECGH